MHYRFLTPDVHQLQSHVVAGVKREKGDQEINQERGGQHQGSIVRDNSLLK